MNRPQQLPPMAKLKNIVRQLSEQDYQFIYKALGESNAEKSAHLLKSLRTRSVSDERVMEELSVNPNAYYTLRSRLNQRIEEYLIQQMESPRTDLLKKVSNIMEIAFTKKHAIAVATLKKLEKELLDYDLFNELMLVYKVLKKLHIHSDEYFTYSQLYNQHVAFMLSLDKVEDVTASYFKKFGVYTLTGDDNDKLELELLHQEVRNISLLHKSHRLYIYQSCVEIFHRLYVVPDDETAQADENTEPLEDILTKVQNIFKSYPKDALYFHIELVFAYLRLEYYSHYGLYRKAEEYYEEVNDMAASLLGNYGWFTYPSQFLHIKLCRALRLGITHELALENEALFEDFEYDARNFCQYLNYMTYRALSFHFAAKHQEAANWLNELLNASEIKKYPFVFIECKTLLALQYVMLREEGLFQQLVSSIQRQIRMLGKEKCRHIVLLIKVMKTALSQTKRERAKKIAVLTRQLDSIPRQLFSPTAYIKFDEAFVEKMCIPQEG